MIPNPLRRDSDHDRAHSLSRLRGYSRFDSRLSYELRVVALLITAVLVHSLPIQLPRETTIVELRVHIDRDLSRNLSRVEEAKYASRS